MHANNLNRLLHGLKLDLFVYVLLLVTKSTVSVDIRCIDRERLALLELKQGFVDYYGRLDTWGDGEYQKECCNWTGVHCSHNTNHVVSLDLRGPYYDSQKWQPLEGIVAPSLSKLDHLTYLDLSCNYFNGTEIPKFIGSLIHLRYLNLSISNFGGTIPHQLGIFSNLEHLDFHNNVLVGVIPHSIGNLSSLEYLDLSLFWNSRTLTSSLEWLPNLTSLQTLLLNGVDLRSTNTWTKLATNSLTHLKDLRLSGCNIVGNIPEQFGALSQLENLDLSLNYFTGIIPHQLGNLSQLQYLRLSFNSLHGYIPNSLWDLCNLRWLDLGSNNLNGRLEDFPIDTMGRTPRCLHQSLQTLELSSNHFTGSIPDLSFFLELQFLNLQDNELNGTLNDGMGQLSSLEGLLIGSNPLQGTITEGHFTKLSKLTLLDMYNTTLSFNISNSWVPPFQLVLLDLGYCKIGPYFPEWLKNQRSIQKFSLVHSEIVHVPDWFWRGNGNLTGLNLSNNKIQGEIANLPVQFSRFSHIDLSANQLRGAIPPFLFQAGALNLSTNMFSGLIFSLCSKNLDSYLNVLDISHNQFSEELPAECWLNFKQLSYLDLSFNNFSGEVPTSLLSLPNLYALHLRNNWFQSIPSMSLSNLTSIRSLDLSENEISGIIPSWIGDEVPNLNVLSLRKNHFYGSLPFNICKLTRILVLDLSTNHLSGSIPKCINQLIALSNSSNVDVNLTYLCKTHDNMLTDAGKQIDHIDITWKGELSDFKSILRLQRTLDLSNNQLTGEIPDEIMDLVQLHSLNLSCNKLGGVINPKIGRLLNLESLDLSWNLLHGPIPPSIGQLNSLGRLNLSFNNLLGKIPTSFHLQTFNSDSYYGNPELCGSPLDRMCPDNRNDNGKSNITDQAEDENNEDLLDVYGFYIFMAFGFIVGFWTSCGSLIFCKSWRYIFFSFCTSICDNMYVNVIILVNKLRKKPET